MSLTLSFVLEVLIGGCFCSVWVLLLINKILDGTLSTLLTFVVDALNIGSAGWFIGLICVYILGWLSQYMCDVIFDNIFEKKIKRNPFATKEDFFRARGLVMQSGSKTILDDIQMDRQLLRLSKHLCLNFFIILVLGFLYIGESLAFSLIVGVISIIVVVTSFLQWKKRYISVMYKFKRAEQSILLAKDKQ